MALKYMHHNHVYTIGLYVAHIRGIHARVRWCARLTRRKEVYFRKKGSTSKCEGEHPVSQYHWSTKKSFVLGDRVKLKIIQLQTQTNDRCSEKYFRLGPLSIKGKRPTISCLLIEIVLVYRKGGCETRISR